MWQGILTGGVKEPGTEKAEFISTPGLLQKKPKKFSDEAYNDKKKGFSLMLLAENVCCPPRRGRTVPRRNGRSCFAPAACRARIADHSPQRMQLSLPCHSLTSTKSKTVSNLKKKTKTTKTPPPNSLTLFFKKCHCEWHK